MKSRLLAGVAVFPALLAGPALPAAPPPQYNWTGFYIGLNAGGAWSSSSTNTFSDCNSNAGQINYYFCFPTDSTNGTAVNAAGSGTIKASGFTGGVELGYNWQTNGLIWGLSTDFSSFHLRGTRQGTGAFPANFAVSPAGTPFTLDSSIAADWLYTLRGRIGTTLMPNLMAYATGGLALTRLTISETY